MAKSRSFRKLVKKVPLKIRLQVSIEMEFINLITKLGYREDKVWGDDEEHIRKKISSMATKLAKDHIEEIENWKKDGEP